jgi:hypothetical protein
MSYINPTAIVRRDTERRMGYQRGATEAWVEDATIFHPGDVIRQLDVVTRIIDAHLKVVGAYAQETLYLGDNGDVDQRGFNGFMCDVCFHRNNRPYDSCACYSDQCSSCSTVGTAYDCLAGGHEFIDQDGACEMCGAQVFDVISTTV